ncbi:MAG: GIY-YIG nuclease family protein [Pirellulales bacterium]
MSPDEITGEIQRLAHENGGKPLGERLFLASVGLTRSMLWSAGFASYSDALIAAGFGKNQFNSALDPKIVLESLFELIRGIGRFPTKGHIKAARAKDNTFPSYEAILTAAGGAFSNLPSVARAFCQANGISDVSHLIPQSKGPATRETKSASRAVTGYVYLLKHGQHYKIGRSNDTARRRREISLLLPAELEHVHIIETDDPEGIEAYWHRRLASMRVRGEWFALTSDDVAAFKRRKYQ